MTSKKLLYVCVTAVLVLVALAIFTVAASTEDYTFVTTWGSSGTSDGQFNAPFGVAVDSSGNVFVADTGNNRIQKFDSSGGYITKWGSQGPGDGQFIEPSGVAVDSSGNVFVVDSWNSRIQKFGSALVPAISVTKTASPTGTCPGSDPLDVSVGDTVTYCFNVTNTGDVNLTNVIVNDDIHGPVTLANDTLAPGETTGGTLTHIVMESDAPSVTNIATATGIDPLGGSVTDTDPCTINVAIAPDIAVVKTASLTGTCPGSDPLAVSIGDTVTYCFNVTNTGDVTLTNVAVVDNIHGPVTLANDTLAPGETTGGTLTHIVVESDAPSVTDIATATGTDPLGGSVTDTDPCTINVAIAPGIEVVKTASPTSGAPSTNVNFTIVVSNTGDCTLDPVKVVDTLPTGMSYVSSSPTADTHNGVVTWPNVGPLAVGTSKTILLVAHIDEEAPGVLNNSVNATGTPAAGDNVFANDTAQVITIRGPEITSFAPPSPVNDTVCTWRTFNVTVNQTVNVSWYLNGALQQTNGSVQAASCTLHASVSGEHNVTAVASNLNGTDSQTWIWNVTEAPQGNDWGITLDVTSGAGTDVAEFGLNADATDGFDPQFDVPEPPSPPPPYQQAYFYYPANLLVKKLSTSYIPHHDVDGAEWNSWPFRVDYSGDASDVTITWNAGDIAAVPENYSLFFVVDGEQVDMRTTPSYTFSATTGTYEFEIIAITAVPYTFELDAGWNMISFPVEPLDNDADTIFGPEYYYLCTWDSDTGCYVPVNAVETEIGYWLLVLEDRNVTVLGTQLSEYNTDLAQGWNMIGSLWTATNVPDGTETVPADQMYPYIYGWCGDHYELTQDIEPGLGYWALAYIDCELHVFPAPPAAPQPLPQVLLGDNDWRVRLALTSGAGTDVAEFGLHDSATDDFSAKLDVPEPPSPPPSATSPYQQAYFYNPENPVVKKLSTCYIPHHFVDDDDDDDEYNSWLFRLDYNGDASDVTVTWNAKDINAVPAEYSLLFIADGEQIDMRTTPSYTFRAKTTRTYEFEIRALTGGKKPDLVIEDSYEKGKAGGYTVFFVVRNIGTATAPGGHYATLYVDGVEIDKKLVPTGLEPGETYIGSFKTKVGLTGKVENIKVCADSYNDVDELDEDNNCLKGRWQPVAEKPPAVKPPMDKPPTDKPPKEKGAGLGD